MMKKLLGMAVISALILSACQKEEVEVQPPVVEGPDTSSQEFIVNSWMYSAMEEVYLWTDYMPESNIPDTDPEAYFETLLYNKNQTEYDRWSWIVDDYDALVRSLSGQSFSYGYELGLYLVAEGSDQVMGVVFYVDKDTPADLAGIKRGQIIAKINGQTPNTSNYRDLFFGQSTQSIEFGELNNATNDLVPNGVTAEVSASDIQKNPIHTSKVLDVEGTKIGYLHYTSFLNAFDSELNSTVMAEFKNSGVKNVVLDFRYNGGGSVLSAQNISSMMLSEAEVGSILTRKRWNDLYQDYFEERAQSDPDTYDGYLYDRVLGQLETYGSENGIERSTMNKLGIEKLVVLTTGRTASASELVINSLRPYMEVITIGESTTGKHVASITIDDSETPKRHNWAIQPIVYRSTNANGDTDYYWDGFEPKHVLRDDLGHDLGDPEEAMLAKAIEEITGTPVAKKAYKAFDEPALEVDNSIKFRTERTGMYDPIRLK